MAGRYFQFASSGSTHPDTAFWQQRVFFDGIPRRRHEIIPTLACTPGMTERAARMLLASAPVADGTQPIAPPWFTGAEEADEEAELLEQKKAALEVHRNRIEASATPHGGRLSTADQQQVDAINRELADVQDRLDNCP